MRSAHPARQVAHVAEPDAGTANGGLGERTVRGGGGDRLLSPAGESFVVSLPDTGPTGVIGPMAVQNLRVAQSLPDVQWLSIVSPQRIPPTGSSAANLVDALFVGEAVKPRNQAKLSELLISASLRAASSVPMARLG